MVMKIMGLSKIVYGGSVDGEEKGFRIKLWGKLIFRSLEEV